MKDGIFQVNVLNVRTNKPLQEKELNGEFFVIAEPGDEYYVTVSIHRSNLNEAWAYNYLRIGLFVDGFDVQYWKRLDFTEQAANSCIALFAKFWGFKENAAEFRSFVFSDPSKTFSASPSSSSSSSSSQSSSTLNMQNGTNSNVKRPMGQIRVIIHDAYISDGMFENKCDKDGASIVTALAPITQSDDTKFWMQPSVGTVAGRQIQTTGNDQFKPILKWKNKSSTPLRTLLLTYHTQQTFDLMEKFSIQSKILSHSSSMLRNSSNNNNDDNESEMLLSSKRSRIEPAIFIDLTSDSEDESEHEHNDDNGNSVNGAVKNSNNGSLQNTQQQLIKADQVTGEDKQQQENTSTELVLNDEVIMVTMPKKLVPILEITDDDDDATEPVRKSFTRPSHL